MKYSLEDKFNLAKKAYDNAYVPYSNFRVGAVLILKNGDVITFDSEVQVLTLEAGAVDGTFAFNAGTSGYLYAASSSKNYLRTQATNNANGSWKITIAADCTATIVAQGTNTNNTMQYNKSSGLFSCYSTSQQAIVIYVLTDSNN